LLGQIPSRLYELIFIAATRSPQLGYPIISHPPPHQRSPDTLNSAFQKHYFSVHTTNYHTPLHPVAASEMDGIEAMGARRAMSLMFTVPERFISFAHMDQKTFFELSDWILANVASQITPEISVEESLFVFLDIVAQGNSFSEVAYGWDHDVELTQGIFLNVLNALTVLRESREIADSCPPFTQTRKRWEVARKWNQKRSRPNPGGVVRIGYDEMCRDGLEVDQECLKEALIALNNFIHENADHDES
jgi:hypothetical protein